jgi:hypothetical protein
VGTNQGGLDTGSIANTTYHVWLIKRIDTGVVDVLFSTSATSPTMPTNYTYKRRIGSILRSGGAIQPFFQLGDRFMWMTPIWDVTAATVGTTATLHALSVPAGIKIIALIFAEGQKAASSPTWYISSPDVLDVGVSLAYQFYTQATGQWAYATLEVSTNTSRQIRARASETGTGINIETLGYIDSRGKDD